MTPPSHRTESRPGDDRIDWDAVWERHARWLRTVVASRVSERDAVDDVLQQVGLAVANPRLRPADRDRIAPWLYRVAIRQSLLHRRTAGRRRKFLQAAEEDLAESDRDDAASPLDWLLRDERLTLAAQALSDLPELDRQLLLLKYTEDWTYQDMADHLGVSLDAIEYRLLRARDRLRRRLTRSGVVEVHS